MKYYLALALIYVRAFLLNNLYTFYVILIRELLNDFIFNLFVKITTLKTRNIAGYFLLELERNIMIFREEIYSRGRKDSANSNRKEINIR